MNPKVDLYLAEGCGRCSLHKTPECKVHKWKDELVLLRELVLDCGLNEEVKWGVACYTYGKSNVLLLSAFKEFCVLSFFKGALLKDEMGILAKPGKNSQATRLLKFTDVRRIVNLMPEIKAYIQEAIEVEKAGLKIDFKAKHELIIPEELKQKFREDTALEKAFSELTPGRQRGYILYFSGAKQSKTRTARIEKYVQKILDGRGFHD